MDGAATYTIDLGVVSSDPAYNGIDPPDIWVVNLDNDVANIVINPTLGHLTTEAGGTASFTVVLTCQPTSNVIIPFTSNDTSEGTVSPPSVTFTPGNYATTQTVIVTGVDDALDDDNVAYAIVTGAATAADPAYNGLNADDVALLNTDNESVSGKILVSPTAGLVTQETGTIAQFSVVLTQQPTANVTIAFSSSDESEGTTGGGSATFTPANWATPQNLIVLGINDATADGNVGYAVLSAPATSTDPNFNGVNAADIGVTNLDNDTADFVLTPTAGLTTTETLGAATFTIRLNSQPSANVTIGLSTSDATEGTVSPASVTFTPVNYSTNQTVTVTGVDDADDDGNVGYAIVTAAATSTDPGYSGRNPQDVAVTNTDNDGGGGFNITPTAGLTTFEGGGNANFGVVLTKAPTANVTIPLASSDATEGTSSVASVTFTTANWNVAQVVTALAANDLIADGNVGYSIQTGAAVSTDPSYSGLNPVDVGVTNLDNDVAGFNISPTAGLQTTEVGGTAQVFFSLNSQPTATVSIGISISDATEGQTGTSTLNFSTANWNIPQSITVSGVNDALDDGNIVYAIVTSGSSTDPVYSVNPPDVSITNIDDDGGGGMVVTPTAGLVTTEALTTATFTIRLSNPPTANVTVPIVSSDASEGTASPSNLTFTTANWNVNQTVTVTGVSDLIADGHVGYSVRTMPASSTDANYNNLDGADVAATNNDDDSADIVVTPTAGLVTTETGADATFTIHLDSQPTADVTIALSSSDESEGTVEPAGVTFTAGNWNTPQTVTVTGQDDGKDDCDIGYTVMTAPATSSDATYGGRDGSDVALTNTDDEEGTVAIDPTLGEEVSFALDRVRPNPTLSNGLTVRFALPKAAPAHLEVIDATGRKLMTKEVGWRGAGWHTVSLEEASLPAGIYWVHLVQESMRRSTRVTVLR
jgi:hypothetical protein